MLAGVFSGQYLVPRPLTLNKTLKMTLKNKIKVIFVFSVLTLLWNEVWRKSESVTEYVAECVANSG